MLPAVLISSGRRDLELHQGTCIPLPGLTGMCSGSAFTFNLSSRGSIINHMINCRIGVSQVGNCITKCVVPRMDTELGAKSASNSM